MKREDIGTPEFEFRAWVWFAHPTLKPSFSDDSSSKVLVLSRGPIQMRRTKGGANFGVTLHNECDVIVAGGCLNLDAISDTDENEF